MIALFLNVLQDHYIQFCGGGYSGEAHSDVHGRTT